MEWIIEKCVERDTKKLQGIRIHLPGMPTRTQIVIPADDITIDERAICFGIIRHKIYRNGECIAYIEALTPVNMGNEEHDNWQNIFTK